jgi:hypothetical protein
MHALVLVQESPCVNFASLFGASLASAERPPNREAHPDRNDNSFEALQLRAASRQTVPVRVHTRKYSLRMYRDPACSLSCSEVVNPQSMLAPGDKIAYSSDGNFRDEDDIGGYTDVTSRLYSTLLVLKTGWSTGYANHIWEQHVLSPGKTRSTTSTASAHSARAS